MTEYTPGSLIVTFFGAYGRAELGGRVPVAALVRLMGAVDIDPRSVRSAVSRLKRREFLVPDRVGGAAGYALSDDARQLLADGDRRIYGSLAKGAEGAEAAEAAWVLAVFSVPETERRKRHLLRSRLARLGFGTAAPGVWIARAHIQEEARHTLRRLELNAYVDLFQGTRLGFEPTVTAVRRWWDLDAIAELHRTFLDAHEPVLAHWPHRSPAPPQAAFRDYLRALDTWRRLPYADPGLPADLLPADWPGARAAQVFRELHARLREAGGRYVRENTGDPRGQ
ncbi:PaaX family transcriptional regulator C-terminal domain-containing protein [Streptomyces sp. H10-C2]|uniref:PaaX family transcriptional regulator n=1 Tax=unclassified Streptomyces TaxID=2593676 RepID=UPI0024B9EE45|nr:MULTISPECIES: PaaX family transcriptional regulator C-terminal domain-containing protein [unclassified Streptomyces]MDJ0344705.1 PaaX family transcriptional regulator C-terminal domain-containing protein [Streptomyces sp. PH10-H1]MDJ0372811.1 PaaX family transcriptional regulator C-terminal domain-containing protein [Streptomyces sp. H10-C2]